MSRRLAALALIAGLIIAVSVSRVVAEDEHPDPRQSEPEEVDPDGLEGIRSGSSAPQAEAMSDAGSRELFLVRKFFRLARLFGG